MNKQKTVREGSNRIVELDEDRERRNVWKVPSRRYNLASRLWAVEPSEQR